MAFYYVKSGGTASGNAGRYASAQTGDFTTLGASGYYDSIEDALAATTRPVDADLVLVSDLHNKIEIDTIAYSIPTATQGDAVKFICVSDSDITQRSSGAQESTAAARNALMTGSMYFQGITINCDLDFTFSAQTWIRMRDSHINMTSASGRQIELEQPGNALELYGSDITFNNGNTGIIADDGCTIKWIGGTFTDDTGLGINALVKSISSVNAGLHIYLENVDLTGLDSILGQVGEIWNADDTIQFEVYGCKVDPGIVYHQVDFSTMGKFMRCAGNYTTTDDDHQFLQHTLGGEVTDQTTIYRDESPAWKASGDKTAFQVDTSTSCSISEPVQIDVMKAYVELSQTTSDEIKIHLATTATLTDLNCFGDIYYKPSPGGTATAKITSQGASVITGVELTDDSGDSTWMNGAGDLVGYNEYVITLDTSGTPGLDSISNVILNICEPSIQAFVDPAYSVA